MEGPKDRTEGVAMRILFLPDLTALLLCFVFWPLFQVLAASICRLLPDRLLDPSSFYFRAHLWERSGRIYERIFRIRKWKKYLPDGGAVVKGGYRKKRLTDFTDENLKRFLIESCSAELTHVFAVPPFILFGLFVQPYVVVLMFFYAVLVNVPCIVSQRYNRPRVSALLDRKRRFLQFQKSMNSKLK
jgi:glycosyl-4,4'-diaponeurosporenoate acyltransferase